jgi:choline dehydrogenase
VELSCFAIDKNARPWFPLLAPRPQPGIGLMIQMVRPHSRGRVTLASSDPLASPRVHLNLLGEETDMARVLGGMRLGRELFSQPALQALGMREDVPGPALRSAAELAEFVRRTCMISHHAAGTCCMGEHGMAVVDPALRVRGIEGLRVADASVMPIVPGANTNAAAMMIGEKAADLVRGLPALPPGVAGHDA